MSKALLHELGKSISFGRLSLPAKVLWPMLLAASDDQGRGMAEPDVIKWHVCPNVAEIEIGNVSGLLDEMAAQDMIALYQDDRDRAIYQIVRWWDFQQPSWAQPSKYSAPGGWLDRIRYQKKGAGLVTQNWADDGGWRCEQEPPSDGDQGNEGPGQEQSSDLPSTLPSDLPSQQGRGTIQDQYNSIQSDLAPGGAPPPEPPAPKPAKPKPRRKPATPKEPPPPAVDVVREVTNLFPVKSLWPGIDGTVGRDPPSLDRWRKTCLAWVACGWNPRNVKGMLEHYVDKKIPSTGKGNGNGRQQTAGAATGARSTNPPATPETFYTPAELAALRAAGARNV